MDSDGDGSIQISQEVVNRLSPSDQRGLQEFLQSENQKNQVQSDVHRLTNMCFKKCVTSIGSGGLASKEQGCMQNCVDRFMDSNLAVLKHLDQLRASQ